MPIIRFLDSFIQRFDRHQVSTLAASLAFYTSLSLAPILILFISVSAHFSTDLIEGFSAQAQLLMGPVAAKTIESIIRHAKARPDLISRSSVFGILTVLISASAIFGQLKFALNRIFEVKPGPPRSKAVLHVVGRYLIRRAFQILAALIFILMLVISLIASSFLSATIHPHEPSSAKAINFVISLLFFCGYFAMTFRFLPDERLPWNQAFRGAAFTSFLFVIGKELIALYLGRSAVASAYGAAGSLIVLLLWVYYSALITFIGAEVGALINHRHAQAKEQPGPAVLTTT